MRAWMRVGAAVLMALAMWSLAGPASAEYLVPEAGIRFPDRLGALALWKGEKLSANADMILPPPVVRASQSPAHRGCAVENDCPPAGESAVTRPR